VFICRQRNSEPVSEFLDDLQCVQDERFNIWCTTMYVRMCLWQVVGLSELFECPLIFPSAEAAMFCHSLFVCHHDFLISCR